MDKAIVPVMEAVFDRNDKIAALTNETLTKQGVFGVNVMGAPGIGKTSSLINIIKHLEKPSFVIEGDIESDIDTIKLLDCGIKAVQLNTFGGCHLDATIIASALAGLDIKDGFVFIENIGNLVCPAEFMIGEHMKLLISSVTEGSDKPYKYPLAFEKADIILINKIDLLEYVEFDEDFFMKGVRALNKNAPVFKVSAKTGEGFTEVAAWITGKAN